MILNIMGLLGVPNFQNMHTLTKTQRGNVNGNMHGNLPMHMGLCMGTQLGTWERSEALHWQCLYVIVGTRMGDIFGKQGTWLGHKVR
jgi:hypothetical protein